MQNIYDCKLYTPNENLNKTCDNKKRCVLIEENSCYDYAKVDVGFWDKIGKWEGE